MPSAVEFRKKMFMSLLNDAGLSPTICAGLLDLDPVRFESWATGQRDLPGFIVPELASVLGVSQETLIQGKATKAPAIWYKFRGEQIGDADRELVILVRRLGFYIHQLNSATGFASTKWETDFAHIRTKLDAHKSDSPEIQGEKAADVFRSIVDLGYSRAVNDEQISGAGDVIRGIVRSLGILLIEMPLAESSMDGCSFYVGDAGNLTPCVFVNTYRQTWFRRNYVLAHELAHAIFDIDGEAALIDYRAPDKKTSVEKSEPPLKEARADAFARTLFSSKKVLSVFASKLGLKWDALSTRDLALLVAHSQVELRAVLRSALNCDLINAEQFAQYSKQSLKKELRTLTERVLTPPEFFKLHPEQAVWSNDLRSTTIPSRRLRLPVPYIMMVLQAIHNGMISDGKAAEMLMMDYEVFLDRFEPFLPELAA